jgi:hypothetical protein
MLPFRFCRRGASTIAGGQPALRLTARVYATARVLVNAVAAVLPHPSRDSTVTARYIKPRAATGRIMSGPAKRREERREALQGRLIMTPRAFVSSRLRLRWWGPMTWTHRAHEALARPLDRPSRFQRRWRGGPNVSAIAAPAASLLPRFGFCAVTIKTP